MINDIERINIAWVGISQKKEIRNLSKNSFSGSLIFKIEKQIKNIRSYKTNLVDFAPADKTGKLCYPTKREINQNFNILWKNILNKKPQIIFLLGGLVASSFESNLKIKIIKWKNYDYFVTYFNESALIAIQHPSYIQVYKKKDTEKYIHSIIDIIFKERDYLSLIFKKSTTFICPGPSVSEKAVRDPNRPKSNDTK
ncbi:MAG: uracil-DNA glycosylase family protein [bacterium]